MVKRVTIDCSGASLSPFRVSVAGVDVDSAEFNDLIFDGNQSPLRLWGTGWGSVSGISYDDWAVGGKNVVSAIIAAGPTTPSGTTPVFMTMWRPAVGGFLRTPIFRNTHSVGAGGGGLSSGNFCGLSFSVGSPGSPSTPAGDIYVNYALFKNYN